MRFKKSTERGRTRIDWLDSRHSFSFGDYFDPENMGFRSLRLINDDVTAPSRGFGTHPHRVRIGETPDRFHHEGHERRVSPRRARRTRRTNEAEGRQQAVRHLTPSCSS